jgi:hypothetical protein
MGEANRKRAAIGNASCPCGLPRIARECCYNGRDWLKRHAVLGLKALPQKSIVKKCYMKELGSCDGLLSGEHLISESVILVLKADGDFSVAGLPWLPEGGAKIVGPKSLTANCLCQKHNSALSPLDDAARYFFSALKLCLDREAEDRRYLVSGHDLERWLLKTIKAFAVSGNLARGQQRLSGAFASDIHVLEMLDDPTSWPEGAGLYCVMRAGDTTYNHNRLQLAPYTNVKDELSGFGVNIMGLDFVLMLEPPDMTVRPDLKGAEFRPGQIMITFANSVNWIAISWEDGKPHDNTMSLKFVRNVDPATPVP